ncbi:hybrid sensor histidine kinase/response regulator [Brevundimonas sp. GW460-12-10-14-LB2]|jgi:signal transduction histidine kinase/CheY-like chemotaxis protein|uniref:response regulator n=1 Tax=Brevundimonas sp. GW460-12-10-14-LB2 TaxID=1827469 RepID=UPI0007BCCCC9|nr:response regulator [Brevundimonas sp. GW460-12-10-14-LB2]ANC52921.1 hybrid sensor histidine kinase/response regulator [Brevundimonas sp. GW460-12-10-14-LB2]MEA3473416.1 response regulator [Pseudomonadota bacterium]
MVESDGVAKALEGEQRAGDAAQALTAILQTQYLRYMIIASWGVGLLGTVGLWPALLWFGGTLAAGSLRGIVEHRLSHRVGTNWGVIFPIVATVTTGAWAIAPLMAWFSPTEFGRPLALALLISGYVLVFAQLRSSPRQALIISSPYGAAATIILFSLWGTNAFWSMLAVLPFTAAGLFVLVTMTLLREDRIRAFQSHQAHLIEELEAARDKANAANDAKSNFLGVISHELRTPMNGVLGAAQLLSATRLETTQREYLSIIRNSGDNLLSLLNDILDMTKIEAGKMNFEVVDVAVDGLNKRITGPFEAQAEAKGLTFVTTVEGDIPTVVRGDPLRVCQVVQNLLSNAVKFTEAGEIHYLVRGHRVSDQRVRFEFVVQDSGAGIAAADLERLFMPFTQVDTSSTRRFGGTGLGLTIARRMANIMGGDITVTSKLAEGSCFTLEIEAEVVEWAKSVAAAEVHAEIEGGESLRVLVVEDHPVNRMILEAWMSSASHVTSTAENGQIAVDIAKDQPFDLIIMDVNMPVMDGLTATRMIREGGQNAGTPIVVLSASARHEDHAAGLQAGADAYLNKPIDFGALAALMGRVGGGRDAVAQMALPSSETSVAA